MKNTRTIFWLMVVLSTVSITHAKGFQPKINNHQEMCKSFIDAVAKVPGMRHTCATLAVATTFYGIGELAKNDKDAAEWISSGLWLGGTLMAMPSFMSSIFAFMDGNYRTVGGSIAFFSASLYMRSLGLRLGRRTDAHHAKKKHGTMIDQEAQTDSIQNANNDGIQGPGASEPRISAFNPSASPVDVQYNGYNPQ